MGHAAVGVENNSEAHFVWGVSKAIFKLNFSRRTLDARSHSQRLPNILIKNTTTFRLSSKVKKLTKKKLKFASLFNSTE